MMTWNPFTILITAFLLLVLGFALPVLMIMQMIPSTFLINFLSYTASTVGLVMGMIGSMLLILRRRKI